VTDPPTTVVQRQGVDPSAGNSAELGSAAVVDFWDRRHQAAGEGASGGHISLGEAGNRAFYHVRLGQLLTLAGGSSPDVPIDALDAGCGKGIFARGMAECGYRVTGFDPSENAIAVCRDKARFRESYAVSTMTSYPSGRLFDFVYSIDVLFHIMDDAEWRASVERLCRLVRLGGRIALVDSDKPQQRRWAQYQKTRPAAAYLSVYQACGIEAQGTARCGPPGFPNVFNIGRRVA
jgi:SAM-dependent methyltransferase